MNHTLAPLSLKNTVPPFGNVNQHEVNIDASNWPGGFSSHQTSLQFGLPNPFRNNVAAAGASALQKGGARRTLRRKIKNVAKKYKMPQRKRKTMRKHLTRRFKKLKGGYLLTSSASRRRSSGRSRRRSYRQRGGVAPYNGGYTSGPYLQYESDAPFSPSYRAPFAVGPGTGFSSALANPVPITRMAGGCGNSSTLCNATGLDNYNRLTNNAFETTGFNTGFPPLNSSVFSK